MKTVKLQVELTADLSTSEEVLAWIQDVIEKNFSTDGEEVLSITLVKE